jgi:hypothetical protein
MFDIVGSNGMKCTSDSDCQGHCQQRTVKKQVFGPGVCCTKGADGKDSCFRDPKAEELIYRCNDTENNRLYGAEIVQTAVDGFDLNLRSVRSATCPAANFGSNNTFMCNFDAPGSNTPPPTPGSNTPPPTLGGTQDEADRRRRRRRRRRPWVH